MTQPDVIVVGGGIGGLSAAYALARKGLRVRVLERAREFGEVGAGIQIAPNCTRILDEYGMLDEAKQHGVLVDNIILRDALDGSVLTRLDLRDAQRRYGFPYVVIHRSDLHALFLSGCRDAGAELLTSQQVTGYQNKGAAAAVTLADGTTQQAPLVVAADGLRSVARELLVKDEPVTSAYVAYRGAVPIERARQNNVSETDVVVHIGPRCHFVQYPLRGGEMFNQVAVFESARGVAGEENWGAPDELDAAFGNACEAVRNGLALMWRDRWWPMFDRDPIPNWVHGRIALLGDAAHPPLQYIAQGAIMAIEDGWVLAEHAARHTPAAPATHVRAATAATQVRAATAAPDATAGGSCVDWDAALAAYEAVRAEHCRRVVLTSRTWGALWHLDGAKRLRRNAILRARDTYDYSFVDWLYERTALTPDEEPEMFQPIPLGPA
jgi:2-polyprenyl-6-methoxyphenol hydroxylase-like FAD-dependent oxidoreductase